jgi:hypothetical protein
MLRRSTWILLVIFAFLVGFTWYFQRYQANKTANSSTPTTTTPAVDLYDLANTQVNDIKISGNSGDLIDLYRDAGSSNWAIADVPVAKADSFKIESISAQLFLLQVKVALTQTPTLDSVGLATPSYTITMTTADGKQLITYVGSQNAIGDGYYVRVDSGPVVIVDKVVLDGILNLLKNPPLLPTATPEVTPTVAASPVEPVGPGTPTP